MATFAANWNMIPLYEQRLKKHGGCRCASKHTDLPSPRGSQQDLFSGFSAIHFVFFCNTSSITSEP